jgi:hypothetical protein
MGAVSQPFGSSLSLPRRLKARASGLPPRAVLVKFATVQMLEFYLPTTDGREIVFHPLHTARKGPLGSARRTRDETARAITAENLLPSDPLKSHTAVVPTF